MNEAKRNSNLAGLIVLFAVLTPVGVLLSYFYIMFQVNTHDIWVNIIANFVFGLVLAALVWIIKRLMRITNDIISLVVVIVSLAVTVYTMWNLWFVLMVEMLYFHRDVQTFSDMGRIFGEARVGIFGGGYLSFIENLRYFNARGTWSLNGTQWNGMVLAAVWAGELIVMIVFPIMVAYASVGLYLAEQGAWVKEKLMNYGFSAFDDEELDQIAAGDTDVILQKPLETKGEAMNAIAVCYHRSEPTEFIALYKAGWDRDGTLTKGRHIMTVKLGIEKIDTLDTKLQAIHYPSPAIKTTEDIPETISEPSSNAIDDKLETEIETVVQSNEPINADNTNNE